MTVRAARLNPRTIFETTGYERSATPECLPRVDRRCVGPWRCPAFRRILRKILGRKDLVSFVRQKIPSKDAIAAREPIGPVEPETDGVLAVDHDAVRERQGHHQGSETSADSVESSAWLCDCYPVIVERYPCARVHLDAGLLRIPQPMDLQPERPYRLPLRCPEA